MEPDGPEVLLATGTHGGPASKRVGGAIDDWLAEAS
jgi:hypothetical protein